MTTVNIHYAKTHLSKLLEDVVAGQSLVIAKSGRPLVKVVPVDAPVEKPVQRLGFLAKQFDVPADFNQMGQAEIEMLFLDC